MRSLQQTFTKLVIVTQVFDWPSPEQKIATLKFPPGTIPRIGMQLKTSHHKIITISGIVFDVVRGDNAWDCMVDVGNDILLPGTVFSIA